MSYVDYDDRVKTARAEALRFTERAKQYLSLKEPGKEHAAMLRASMDLSRALSDVRRGRYL